MRVPSSILAVLLLVAACGGEEGVPPAGGEEGLPPAATFESMQRAICDRDGEAMYQLLEPAARERAEKDWEVRRDTPEGRFLVEMLSKALGLDAEKARRMSARELFLAAMAKRGERTDDADLEHVRSGRVVDTKIDGDRAVVKVRTGDVEEEIEMVRSGGRWYLGGEMLPTQAGGEK